LTRCGSSAPWTSATTRMPTPIRGSPSRPATACMLFAFGAIGPVLARLQLLHSDRPSLRQLALFTCCTDRAARRRPGRDGHLGRPRGAVIAADGTLPLLLRCRMRPPVAEPFADSSGARYTARPAPRSRTGSPAVPGRCPGSDLPHASPASCHLAVADTDARRLRHLVTAAPRLGRAAADPSPPALRRPAKPAPARKPALDPARQGRCALGGGWSRRNPLDATPGPTVQPFGPAAAVRAPELSTARPSRRLPGQGVE